MQEARITTLPLADDFLPRLRYLDDILHGVITLGYSPHALRGLLPLTDLLIGTVLIRGARAPRLVTRDMLDLMKPGAVSEDPSFFSGVNTYKGHLVAEAVGQALDTPLELLADLLC